jgi:phosphomannomutase
MTLIKSISGIRGTIGGKQGENLTPVDITKFACAYGQWLLSKKKGKKVIIGRDARISGDMLSGLVSNSLIGMGIDVLDLGLSTTPTVEMTVEWAKAAGGIILTASHNPKQWNALKLLNHKGEFVSAKDGEEILKLAEKGDFEFAEVTKLGKYEKEDDAIDLHIETILNLPLVDIDAIKKRNFKVVIDAVNSTGGIAVPKLLKALGVDEVVELYCEPTGKFPHNPEPLPEHLVELSTTVKKEKADLGISVDPDVDRLALVCEDGEMFGEEYTLVSVADYILSNEVGNTVSNLSSTKALKELTEKYGGEYNSSAVGEVNVVEVMKATKAIIGGEGNGGIIYPKLHYGRDSLVGIALFLSHLAKHGKSCTSLRAKYPNYIISKNKVELEAGQNLDEILSNLKDKYKKEPIDTTDGVKIHFNEDWVHLRKSNTEPIIRIYAESSTQNTANALANKIIKDIGEFIN